MTKNLKIKKLKMIIILDMILNSINKIVLRKKILPNHKKMRRKSSKKPLLYRNKIKYKINNFQTKFQINS